MSKSKKSTVASFNISKKNPIKNIIVVSDTHCGCRLGLCGPDGVNLDDGGKYLPSKAQLKVWNYWEEFWNDWVPTVTKGEPYDLVHNGDCIDGVHHNSTTQISHNINDQQNLAIGILKPVVEKCRELGGHYYHIRGTEAHVGKSANFEEEVAKQLGAIPNEVNQYARWDLWKKIGGSGLVHFLHHVGTTASSAHESSAVNAELAATFNEAGRWGDTPPDVVVRSHRHRNIEVRIPTYKGFASSIVTPAWQLKTPFTYKIPGARLAPPQIGGILIRQGDRILFTDSKVWHIERSPVE